MHGTLIKGSLFCDGTGVLKLDKGAGAAFGQACPDSRTPIREGRPIWSVNLWMRH